MRKFKISKSTILRVAFPSLSEILHARPALLLGRRRTALRRCRAPSPNHIQKAGAEAMYEIYAARFSGN